MPEACPVLPKASKCTLDRDADGLQDDRAVTGLRGLHLFQVVDAEGWHALAVFGSVAQDLAQASQCHGMLFLSFIEIDSCLRPPHKRW